MVGSSSLQLADLSENQALVADNLRAILNSEAYRRAHEDASLLQSDEMRGVRMLLEITKMIYYLFNKLISSSHEFLTKSHDVERSHIPYFL